MAKHLESHILEKTEHGWTGPWWPGLGQVPLGLTTHASNSFERTWRTIKGPLRPGSVAAKWFDLTMFFLFQKLPLGHGTCERMRACLPEASTVGEKQRRSTIDD